MVLDIPQPLRRNPCHRLSYLLSNPHEAGQLVAPDTVQAVIDAIQLDSKVPRHQHRDLFSLTRRVTFLNHGSFGGVPISVQLVRSAWSQVIEEEPVDVLVEFEPYIALSLIEVSSIVGCDAHDLVFVENATTGTNTVLKSLVLSPKDSILKISLAYPSVSSTISYIHDTLGVSIIELKVSLPTTNSAIIQQLCDYFHNNSIRPTIAIFDHITSSTGLVLPVRELVHICRNNGVITLIDGAHAIGQIPVNIQEIDPDFYVTNCHKWMFTPRGCAILYIKRQWHDKIHPLSTSSAYKSGLQSEFLWPGTYDISVYLTVTAGIKFYKSIGGVNTMYRNHTLLQRTAEFLVDVTKGQLMTKDMTMLAMMATIQLPINNIQGHEICFINRVSPQEWNHKHHQYPMILAIGHSMELDYDKEQDPKQEPELTPEVIAIYLHDTLRQHYGIEVWCNVVEGRVIIRVSVQTYNQATDYVTLAYALWEILQEENEKLDPELVNKYLSDTDMIEREFAIGMTHVINKKIIVGNQNPSIL